VGWWTKDRRVYAVDFLVNNGLSPWGAAALVSRWANVESVARGPTAVNPGKDHAFGIAQWLGARKAGIYPNTNFDAQLAYAVDELQRPESRDTGRGYQILQTATNADQGAVGATMFERAEHYNSNTGRDDYTSRTASGAPSILAEWQASSGNTSLLSNNLTSNETGAANVTALGLGTGAILGIALGAVALYLIFSD